MLRGFAFVLGRRTYTARPKSRRIIETARAAVHNVREPDHPAHTRSPELFHEWVRSTENQGLACAGCRDFSRPTACRRPVMSVDVGEDSIELVQAVVADDQLAFAAGRVLDSDLRAKLLRQFLLQAVYVRIAR
jgi:hypothetical protein